MSSCIYVVPTFNQVSLIAPQEPVIAEKTQASGPGWNNEGTRNLCPSKDVVLLPQALDC